MHRRTSDGYWVTHYEWEVSVQAKHLRRRFAARVEYADLRVSRLGQYGHGSIAKFLSAKDQIR
jgi:hypothetical protein